MLFILSSLLIKESWQNVSADVYAYLYHIKQHNCFHKMKKNEKNKMKNSFSQNEKNNNSYFKL